MDGLAKALWRAAINPAAVYGRSGRPYASSTVAAANSGADSARPVLRLLDPSGAVFYAPAFPSWCMRYSGCPIADKARGKYGERTDELALPPAFAVDAQPVFHTPTIDDVFVAETLDRRVSFPAVSVGWHDEYDYCAVPLAYLWRRYGAERLKWRQTGKGMLSAWVSDRPAEWQSLCVGLIAPCRVSTVERP